MILFTSGFPYSGKTTFIEKLIEKLDGELVLHINPKDYYPDDFDSLPDEERMAIATTAWEMSLEKATKSICALPNRALIVFDTCCSKSLHMRPLFLNSKLRGHDTILSYVDAHSTIRFKRSAENEKIRELEDKYRTSFRETLPTLRSLSDHFFMIDSNCSDENLIKKFDENVERVAGKIKSIRSR